MLTIKNTLLTLLTLLTLALSVWSILSSHTLQADNNDDNTNEPDSYMEDFQAIILNKDGKPSLKVSAPKMLHYLKEDSTEMTRPHVTVYRHSPQPWFIDSAFAKTRDGIDEIIFSQHVVIHHPADIENPSTSMTTDALTIFPNEQLARTDQPITFIQPDTQIHAIGMFANLNEGTIKLLSQTKGEYVPSS